METVKTDSPGKSKVTVRRLASGGAGMLVLLATLFMAYNTARRAYYDYYFYPKVKEGYIMPTRWQDFGDLALFCGATILLLYLSYRLLKYAFRRTD